MVNIKGIKQWYNANFADDYTGNEGWAISDAGPNDNEKGFHLILEFKNRRGKKRELYVSFTKEALQEMLANVENRWPSE